jgi:hypothetical protein
LRRRSIDFKLDAHFLDLSGLLFELGGENFHPFLLLSYWFFFLLPGGVSGFLF